MLEGRPHTIAYQRIKIRAVIIRTDRNIFARFLVICQSRQMDLSQSLVHELGPLQWLLGLFDGALVKANKAALPKLLGDGVEGLQSLPAQTIAVMGMLQTVRKTSERFLKLEEMIFKSQNTNARRRSKRS